MAENTNDEKDDKFDVAQLPDDGSPQWSDDDDTIWMAVPLSNESGEAGPRAGHEKRGEEEANESTEIVPAKKRRLMEGLSPLEAFRGRYLWVSDVMSQMWCEQQLHYTFTAPVSLVTEKPVMTAGTDMHLARELEVQDTVKVKITSDVDIFAIKLFNLYSAVHTLLTGGATVRREIPIFGAPFNHGVFMIGLIDEIRIDPVTFHWEIVELKTRRMNSVPSKAQKSTHHVQIMLYKRLFDDLIEGKTTKELLQKHLNLDFETQFGDDVQKHLKDAALDRCTNLGTLWSKLKELLGAVTTVQQLWVEYCWQDDRSTIAIEECQYNRAWLQTKLTSCIQYWKGRREVVGVDIEDAWKCQKCDFADICEWRQKKAEEHRIKNAVNSS